MEPCRQVAFRRASPEGLILRTDAVYDDMRNKHPLSGCIELITDHRLRDRRVLNKGVFNLACLDAKSFQVDLVILATQKLDIAIWSYTSHISCAIHASARWTEWVSDKCGLSSLRLVEIAKRNTHTAKADALPQPPACTADCKAKGHKPSNCLAVCRLERTLSIPRLAHQLEW